MNNIKSDWLEIIGDEFEKPYYTQLWKFIKKEYDEHTVFPPFNDIFSAFQFTGLKDVKVVIIGQDPYHNEGQSHGLCFSVKSNVKIPPSLRNIYKELHDDVGCDIPTNGYLEKWARQGVLLLNTVLTVRAHEPNSHRKKGWELFTDAVIDGLNKEDRPIVFILWGRPARMKSAVLTNDKHLIIESPHPSPLSAFQGFFGSKPFSKTNDFLVKNNISPIDWQIENI